LLKPLELRAPPRVVRQVGVLPMVGIYVVQTALQYAAVMLKYKDAKRQMRIERQRILATRVVIGSTIV
jgi:hypothetical protein